jgi:hypothetical protein
MTPIAGFFLAVIAGWIVREPRRAAATVVLPYLAIVAVQTWDLANGYGINPPDTVTPFSGAISYWVVQAVFGLIAMAIAAELAVLRAPGRGARATLPVAGPWYRAAVATAICDTGVIAVLVAWLASAKLVAHHSTTAPTPAQGVIGIGLDLVGVVAFGIAALWVTIKARRSRTAPESLVSQPPAGSAVS